MDAVSHGWGGAAKPKAAVVSAGCGCVRAGRSNLSYALKACVDANIIGNKSVGRNSDGMVAALHTGSVGEVKVL